MNVYETLLDVPVDDYNGDDHDDSTVPAGQTPHDPPRLLSLAAAEPIAKPNAYQAVPFIYVKSGDSGPAALAVVRALSRAGYGAWKGRLFSNRIGVFATRNLNAFKRDHDLPANGIYDKATWRELAPWFDAYSIRYLLNSKASPKPSKEELLRNAFLAELMYLYNRRSVEPYTQARPWDQRKPPRGLDCSASGEWAAKWTGVMTSLSGYIGWGYGNTYSQLEHYRQLNALRAGISVADIGDPIYYGAPTHVAYWIGGGRVWSFGAYPIKILPHDYRHDRAAICNLAAGQL